MKSLERSYRSKGKYEVWSFPECSRVFQRCPKKSRVAISSGRSRNGLSPFGTQPDRQSLGGVGQEQRAKQVEVK